MLQDEKYNRISLVHRFPKMVHNNQTHFSLVFLYTSQHVLNLLVTLLLPVFSNMNTNESLETPTRPSLSIFSLCISLSKFLRRTFFTSFYHFIHTFSII